MKKLNRYRLRYIENKVFMPCDSVVIGVSCEKGIEENFIFIHTVEEIPEINDDIQSFEQRTFIIVEFNQTLKRSVEYIGSIQLGNAFTQHVFEVLKDEQK